mmetsp:Transcript_11834/g.30874  ORF Transcript_11834/g.30874 Transcript_11834/m.30874 type:complete len:238 (-) Transcript_11834:303-1016(-)
MVNVLTDSSRCWHMPPAACRRVSSRTSTKTSECRCCRALRLNLVVCALPVIVTDAMERYVGLPLPTASSRSICRTGCEICRNALSCEGLAQRVREPSSGQPAGSHGRDVAPFSASCGAPEPPAVSAGRQASVGVAPAYSRAADVAPRHGPPASRTRSRICRQSSSSSGWRCGSWMRVRRRTSRCWSGCATSVHSIRSRTHAVGSNSSRPPWCARRIASCPLCPIGVHVPAYTTSVSE